MNPFKSIQESFKKAWRGEERLWKVFWLWGVLAAAIFIWFVWSLYDYLYHESFGKNYGEYTYICDEIIILYNLLYMPFFAFFMVRNIKNVSSLRSKAIAGIGCIIIMIYLLIIFPAYWLLGSIACQSDELKQKAILTCFWARQIH